MREVLVDCFGEDWYSEFWPFVNYVVGETRKAFENGFRSWFLSFIVNGWEFSGSVDNVLWCGWWVYIRNGSKVVRIERDRVWVGYYDENGDVVWSRSVLYPRDSV